MADETAVLLNISEMIDLAIGSPEVGVVDFNMLQTVLHCLAQQLRVLGKNVELRGSMTVVPVAKENAQTIAISEYIVDTDDKAPERKKIEEAVPLAAKPTENETILVVERIKKTDSPSLVRSPVRDRSPPMVKSDQTQSKKVSSSEKLSLVTLSKFNLLEDTVEDIKNRVYGSIPKNDQILEEVRSQTNLKAITDMWTSLNVSSRLEAAEEGITKLSSLVQDLISETSGLQDAIIRRSSKADNTAITSEPVKTAAPARQADTGTAGTLAGQTVARTTETPATQAAGGIVGTESSPSTTGPEGSSALSQDESAAMKKHLDKMRADLDELANAFYQTMEDLQGGFDSQKQTPPTALEADGRGGQPTSAPALRPTHARRSFSVMTSELMSKIADLEKKLNKCCDSIGKTDVGVQDQINSFQDQLEYLMKQVAALTQDLAAGKLSPDLIKDLQGLMQLFSTVQDMQEQLKQVHDTALQLAAEKEDRQHNINALLEQIELLKTVKLDKEDMVEAMAEKADLRLLARKVSHDQFELACDDLSRGLEHALGKLNLQESLWQQALDDIQREIETKLDKMELSPVKEFFNDKLRQLQENLKQMASLRREAEAAGTKRKLLRDVYCISCDAKAVMATEPPSTVPVSRPMPANLSMKPYLSYELDAIRKAQQTNVPQRNMHDWETIDKQMGHAKQPQKTKSEPDKHLCNRYCGGSHTVTTPAQRVARLGHFIKQWGPDVLPLSSGFATGDDGRLYKVSTSQGASVGPGGAVDTVNSSKPTAKPEKAAPQPKATIISAECRCLEGDHARK